jgi:hypothetical protein
MRLGRSFAIVQLVVRAVPCRQKESNPRRSLQLQCISLRRHLRPAVETDIFRGLSFIGACGISVCVRQASAVVVAGRMEHIEDDAGSKGARGMALMWRDMKQLAWLQDKRDAGDREFEGAAKQQSPLLVRVGVIGDDRAGSDVNPALGNMVRVEIATEVPRSDLTRCNGGEVK